MIAEIDITRHDAEVERAFLDAFTLFAKDAAFMTLVLDIWG